MIKKTLFALALGLCAAAPAGAQQQAAAEEEAVVAIDNTLDEATIPAPDFTLKNLVGEPVSLSEFQGQWVVLDFWGSWCRYCIAGIPDMKEAYATYHPKGLEIIGIDCNEPEVNWQEAVARYELPWINVYNPGGRDSAVTQAYEIKGYPTKIIIDPEGYVRKVVLGEDPVFYEFLKEIYD